ncbi:Enhancer of polycomb-like protein 1 [Lecanora helva]
MTRSQAFRQRKLNTRQALSVLRDDQIEKDFEDDIQRNVPKIDTGVEQGEQNEHHLQAALLSQAAAVGGKVAQIYIPTPDAVQSSVEYDKLYPLTYSQPATYTRFSSTVEDCAGCPYDLDEEDDAFLKSMNKKRNAATQCSEDQFEEVMNCFEEIAQLKQPYASVDSPPVLSYEDIENSMDDYVEDNTRPFTKDIYEYWKARRLQTGNKPLLEGLKFETGADTDDADPYVCFRRREVRQVRKTRGRDAHSAEKLKKLRKELEEARDLLAMIRQREITKREQLAVDRQLFEQRTNLRQLKLNLPDQYKEGDDDLLINQKPKKKPADIPHPRGGQLSLPRRTDSRSADADLVLLSDILADKEKHIAEQIDLKIAQHKQWNIGWVDATMEPLTPPLEIGTGSTFRTATTEYLPTPPTSISSHHSGDVAPDIGALNLEKKDSVAVRYASPSYDGPRNGQPSFRRRYGRGGRLWIDRRATRLPSKPAMDSPVSDGYKFDDDDDDEDEVQVYFHDPFDAESMQFRAGIFPPPPSQAQMQARRAQIEAHAANNIPTRSTRQSGSD